METQSDAENLEKYRINLKELGYESTAHIGYGGTVKAIVDITEENKLETTGHGGTRTQRIKRPDTWNYGQFCTSQK